MIMCYNNTKGVIIMANSNINIRVDSDVKAQAQRLFSDLGMDLTTAVNVFLRQSIEQGGIPFMIQRRYGAETEQAMKEARDIINGKVATGTYASARELFEELDNEC